jgi:hypothetical protein
VTGVDGGSFAHSILNNLPLLDTKAARTEMVAGAEALCLQHPNVGAIVLECTNMPPYADDIALATGKPVYSILTHLDAFHRDLPKH